MHDALAMHHAYIHICISYIILTPYFIAIIDSSGKGSRLERITSSPHSIAASHTVEEMEQQGGKWSTNNVRVIIQDKLKQALARLMLPPATVPTPTAAILPTVVAPIIVNPPVVDAPHANNDNVGGNL